VAGWPILNFAPFAKFRVGTLSGPLKLSFSLSAAVVKGPSRKGRD